VRQQILDWRTLGQPQSATSLDAAENLRSQGVHANLKIGAGRRARSQMLAHQPVAAVARGDVMARRAEFELFNDG
jgi:hypothetical protein